MQSTERYDLKPAVRVNGEHVAHTGWKAICESIQASLESNGPNGHVLAVDCYPGVLISELSDALTAHFPSARLTFTETLMHAPDKIREMVHPDVTDDRIFGFMTRLDIDAYFDTKKLKDFQEFISTTPQQLHIILGPGASFAFPGPHLLVYADMARWEIQLRMRKHLVSNLGVDNKDEPDWMRQYKQGLFVDWRVADRWKKKLMHKWDFVLDTNATGHPVMVTGHAIRDAFRQTLKRPFAVVPFFDPGPWGGQWMREKFGLPKEAPNYAWCFNCVPEENSLLLDFNGVIFETPSVNLVYIAPERLLGEAVFGRFGDEFPIRFDLLDTMGGGHLSLQVHPDTAYIREKFGLAYTQDESYYMLDAAPGAQVYLGLREDIDPEAMLSELEQAATGGPAFDADKHVNAWAAKKHDHFLIPGGTVHCSGKDSMVLEISATPFIYTFKLWDWGRLGMDGKPRPINIGHGRNVIRWDRKTEWTERNLVNQVMVIAEGDGWKEERTGLHETEFIETRRHWFTKSVVHHTDGSVNVLCLVEGDAVLVESPFAAFEPFEVHYAEVFIVPAQVGTYIIRPAGQADKYATMKAFVRTNA